MGHIVAAPGMVMVVSTARRVPPLRSPGRARRARATASRRTAPPLAKWALLGCALVALVWWGYRQWQAVHTTLRFERDGAALPALELTFYPDQLAFAAPSPPPPIGRLQLAGDASVCVGRALVPGRAVVRYSGPGIGTGLVFVRLGYPLPTIHLRASKLLQGRVAEPIGFWCFGWRCAGLQPVAGAEVVVMGGGEHGIDLGSAVTDAEGNFTIDGIDGELDGLGLRVRAKGFAIGHQPLERLSEASYPLVALARTQPVLGRIMAPAELDLSSLRVLARGLPGVEAKPATDGTFVLDHVPSGVEPRLLLYGLPPVWTHATVRARADATSSIEVVRGAVVRGRVVDGQSQSPLPGALVFCGDRDAVLADASGRFELTHLVPGSLAIQAQWQAGNPRRRVVPRLGSRQLMLEPSQVLEDVVIAID